jgi:hypothetical protein
MTARRYWLAQERLSTGRLHWWPTSPPPGVFTSGIVSTRDGHRVALFFTGHRHAGENLAEVLAHRAAELSARIQMCDALSRNVPKLPRALATIVANCLAHASTRSSRSRVNEAQRCVGPASRRSWPADGAHNARVGPASRRSRPHARRRGAGASDLLTMKDRHIMSSFHGVWAAPEPDACFPFWTMRHRRSCSTICRGPNCRSRLKP